MPLYWEALWGSFVGTSVWEAGKGVLDWAGDDWG